MYDTHTNRPLSILDQTEFFVKASSLVEKAKNKAEAQAIKGSENKPAPPPPKGRV